MRWTKTRLSLLRERLAQAYPDARCALNHGDPFQLVVATILSAQCTDARVNLTTPALFARFPDAKALASAGPAELEGLIHATGFFRNKAKNLIGLGQALLARHGGQVPSDPEALGALPGVGQKTANVVLANAFGVPALAVDTHIFRVARRLGLSEAGTPEKVEADLCAYFPRESWIELHHQLIWHGRRTCDARRPACLGCPVADLCPTGQGWIPDPHTGQSVNAVARNATPALRSGEGGPRRIVSLVPSVTELLASWGLVQRLAGRTRYCVEPAWIRSAVPALGGTKDPDVPAILAQRPDLVILERHENTREAAEALRDAGVPLLVLEIATVEDIRAALKQLGERLEAEAAAKTAIAALDALPARLRRKGPRTLTLVWKEPWIAAGPDTYLADMARRAGFQPIGPAGYPRLSDEEFQALDPTVILLPTDPFRFTARHRNELTRRFPKATVAILDGKALTWMLSRTVEGLEILRELRSNLAP